jgi:hypothetical protein
MYLSPFGLIIRVVSGLIIHTALLRFAIRKLSRSALLAGQSFAGSVVYDYSLTLTFALSVSDFYAERGKLARAQA